MEVGGLRLSTSVFSTLELWGVLLIVDFDPVT